MGLFDFLGGAHTPVEAPNSLQSRSVIRVVDLISEGEIVGLVNGLQSVYFDNTVLQNANGSFNYSNVTIDSRVGTVGQEPILGFSDVETEVAVSTEVIFATPIVKTVSDTAATSLRVTVDIPALSATDTSTGDTNPYFVGIKIEVQPNAGTYAQVVADTIYGKTTAPYTRAYRFPLTGTGPWNVKFTRVSPDATNPRIQNKTFWSTYTVIEDFQFRYPYSALVATVIDAQSFGGRVPTRTFEVKGIKISVPANYNPDTRAYATTGTGTTGGIWNGTFKTAWTDNPAWIFYDLLTNDRYGLGQFIPAASVDKYGLYTIAQYCDALVSDGFGGHEARYTFNGVIATADDALKVLTMIASVFRGMGYWGPSGVMATADMPSDPVKMITPANVIDGMINYSGTALKAGHTAAQVTWYNPANLYQTDIEVVENAAAIARFGYRLQQIVAVGCTSRGRAHRIGDWLLDTEANETETATWAASWDQADALPGEIVEIADPAYSGLDFGGRLASVAGDAKSVTIDRPITLESGKTYSIDIELADGTIASRPVTTGATTTQILAFDVALSPVPVTGAVWVVTSSSVAPRKFRIITRTETEKHIFAFSALFHDTTKYDRIEQGLIIEAPSYTALPTGPIVAPTALTADEVIALAPGGIPRAKVVLSWTAALDPRVVSYEIQTSPPDQNWQAAGTTIGVSFDVFDLVAGTWGFRVRSVDALGAVSPWLTVEAAVLDGMLLPPDDLTNVRAAYVDGVMNLRWDEIPDFRQVKYEIRKGDSWAAALTVGIVLHPPFETHGDGTYWVAAYIGPDAGPRNYADNPSEVLVTGSLLTANVLAEWDEAATGWVGTFGGTGALDTALNAIRTGGTADLLSDTDILDDTDILNGGGQDDATYEIPPEHFVNIGRVAPCPVSIAWKATGVPVGQDVLGEADILADLDFLGAERTRFIDVYPEIAVSQTGGGNILSDADILADTNVLTFGVPWSTYQKFSPGTYVGQFFKARMQLKTTDPSSIAYALSFVFTVDVPDRVDHLTGVTVPDVGLPIVFTPNGAVTAAPFNGGPNGAVVPNVQVTIHDAQAGDLLVVSGRTLAGCTLAITNTGVPVQRNDVDVTIQGY